MKALLLILLVTPTYLSANDEMARKCAPNSTTSKIASKASRWEQMIREREKAQQKKLDDKKQEELEKGIATNLRHQVRLALMLEELCQKESSGDTCEIEFGKIFDLNDHYGSSFDALTRNTRSIPQLAEITLVLKRKGLLSYSDEVGANTKMGRLLGDGYRSAKISISKKQMAALQDLIKNLVEYKDGKVIDISKPKSMKMAKKEMKDPKEKSIFSKEETVYEGKDIDDSERRGQSYAHDKELAEKAISCARCGANFVSFDKKIVNGEQVYHEGCLKCDKCHNGFEGGKVPHKTRDGRVLHETCYFSDLNK